MHGTMDDQLIRSISDRLNFLRKLDERREEIRAAISSQEKMTDEISAALEKAVTLTELEDIYRPFRPKRKTRASVAKEKGLEPLSNEILLCQSNNTDVMTLCENISIPKGSEHRRGGSLRRPRTLSPKAFRTMPMYGAG